MKKIALIFLFLLCCQNEIIEYDYINPLYFEYTSNLLNGEFKIVTLNLWRPGPDHLERTQRIVKELKKINPDILLFQEIKVSADFNIALKIAEAMGMSVIYSPGTDVEGCAIVSRLNIWKIEKIWYYTKDMPTRQAIGGATIIINPYDMGLKPSDMSGQERLLRLTMISTHLNKGMDPEPRLQEITELATHFTIFTQSMESGNILFTESTYNSKPYYTCEDAVEFVILGGDFNALEDEKVIKCLVTDEPDCPFSSNLVDTFRLINPDMPGYTWDSKNPNTFSNHESDSRLDYIFFGVHGCNREQAAQYVKSSSLVFNEMVDGMYVSDHFGVLTIINVPKRIIEK